VADVGAVGAAMPALVKQSPDETGTYDPIASNVERVATMERTALESRSRGEWLMDYVVRVGGTPHFALGHVAWFTVWIILNVGVVPGLAPFDPYPYSFLTLVVSLEAIFLSIAILTSENLSMRLADRRANLDLQVNLLAEQESTATLQLVRQIAEHLGIMKPADRKAADLAVETNVQDVLDQLERHLPKPAV
jgi:uncharacterized membrane protein